MNKGSTNLNQNYKIKSLSLIGLFLLFSTSHTRNDRYMVVQAYGKIDVNILPKKLTCHLVLINMNHSLLTFIERPRCIQLAVPLY